MEISNLIQASQSWGVWSVVKCECGFIPHKSEQIVILYENKFSKPCPNCGKKFKIDLKIFKEG